MRVDCHLNGVGVAGLSEELDGEGVVLGGEGQVGAGLAAIDEELIVLGTLDFYLTFKIVAVVEVERQEADALAVLQRGEHLTAERGGGLGGEGQVGQEAFLVELLAIDIDGISAEGGSYGEGAGEVEFLYYKGGVLG